jgi:hypothetical protein
VAENRAKEAEKQRALELAKAREAMIVKARRQLEAKMEGAPPVGKSALAESKEVNFLLGVATGGANRQARRRQQRKMKLLPSQRLPRVSK